jgi:hypothetical protein
LDVKVGHDGSLVEDLPKNDFVVGYGIVHDFLVLAEKALNVFCMAIRDTAVGKLGGGGIFAVPHPKTGVPGTGDLTLAVLGELGVFGRAAILDL